MWVLDVQAAQHRGHRRSGEHLHVEKAVTAPLDVFVLPELLLLHPLACQPGHAGVDRSRLRAADAQPWRAAALVEDLDNRRRVASLLQDRGSRASRNLDPHLGIDVDDEHDAIVEELLQFVGIAGLCGCGHVPTQLGSQGRAKIVECLQQAFDVGAERLRFDSNPCNGPGARLIAQRLGLEARLSPRLRACQVAGSGRSGNHEPETAEWHVKPHDYPFHI